ncbi:hypothetical protein P691DRAFT_818216 [Macrolepiota fuliginosa MF-IS2]|uniref:Uncharacterized protein n=1 Tax=Macrolepiota fuliginosa MF-IS2 TaxID=1400762 RepID=A0A9P5XB29_9AGAR|nr:hypothetical protein P691DRAFT_818216 [Macrolepiota fuliginosa MF-IS2]
MQSMQRSNIIFPNVFFLPPNIIQFTTQTIRSIQDRKEPSPPPPAETQLGLTLREKGLKPTRKGRKDLILVKANPGDKITCRWNGCTALLDATDRTGFEKHLKRMHAPDQAAKDDVCCRWEMSTGNECGYTGQKCNLGKHVSRHLHEEGQPSPHVHESSECCGKTYVARGSGYHHEVECKYHEGEVWLRMIKRELE